MKGERQRDRDRDTETQRQREREKRGRGGSNGTYFYTTSSVITSHAWSTTDCIIIE